MHNRANNFVLISKTKMTNREVTLHAFWDALEGSPYPREYDGWSELDQVNYERIRLNTVNILTHSGSVPPIENPRNRGHRSVAWITAVCEAEQAIGSAIPPMALASADGLGL